MRDPKDKIITIPNIITCFRMIASIILCIYIGVYGINHPIRLALVTIGIGLTDAIDGYLARNCGMASRIGSLLDPIADKVFNWGLWLTLTLKGIMPLWPLVIAIRDLTVFFLTYYQYKVRHVDMTPTLPAKAKMVFQSIAVVTTIAFGFGNEGLSLIAPIFMILAIITVIPEIFFIKKQYFDK